MNYKVLVPFLVFTLGAYFDKELVFSCNEIFQRPCGIIIGVIGILIVASVSNNVSTSSLSSSESFLRLDIISKYLS